MGKILVYYTVGTQPFAWVMDTHDWNEVITFLNRTSFGIYPRRYVKVSFILGRIEVLIRDMKERRRGN